MVLNIPSPQRDTHKHSALLCQAQQASCDGALLVSYLPDENNGVDLTGSLLQVADEKVTTGRAAEVTLV